ncbi:hypothetical protein AB431_10700 [Mycobacterium sp. EPa45]|nr:hypothetical protein AB431_10700 [Mycobacterium sp. EPa45]
MLSVTSDSCVRVCGAVVSPEAAGRGAALPTALRGEMAGFCFDAEVFELSDVVCEAVPDEPASALATGVPVTAAAPMPKVIVPAATQAAIFCGVVRLRA